MRRSQDELVTIKEAMEITGLCWSVLYQAITDGWLFAIKRSFGERGGHRWYIARGDLSLWQEQKQKEREERKNLSPPQGLLANLPGYTKRERQIMEWVAESRRPQDIAAFLGLTLSTVKGHLSNIYAKLGVSKRMDAMAAIKALPRSPQPPDREKRKKAPSRGYQGPYTIDQLLSARRKSSTRPGP